MDILSAIVDIVYIFTMEIIVINRIAFTFDRPLTKYNSHRYFLSHRHIIFARLIFSVKYIVRIFNNYIARSTEHYLVLFISIGFIYLD